RRRLRHGRVRAEPLRGDAGGREGAGLRAGAGSARSDRQARRGTEEEVRRRGPAERPGRQERARQPAGRGQEEGEVEEGVKVYASSSMILSPPETRPCPSKTRSPHPPGRARPRRASRMAFPSGPSATNSG